MQRDTRNDRSVRNYLPVLAVTLEMNVVVYVQDLSVKNFEVSEK